jgi:hypothetical protein
MEDVVTGWTCTLVLYRLELVIASRALAGLALPLVLQSLPFRRSPLAFPVACLDHHGRCLVELGIRHDLQRSVFVENLAPGMVAPDFVVDGDELRALWPSQEALKVHRCVREAPEWMIVIEERSCGEDRVVLGENPLAEHTA